LYQNIKQQAASNARTFLKSSKKRSRLQDLGAGDSQSKRGRTAGARREYTVMDLQTIQHKPTATQLHHGKPEKTIEALVNARRGARSGSPRKASLRHKLLL